MIIRARKQFASLTIVLALAMAIVSVARAAAPPAIISYQGRLLSSSGVPLTAATASIVFKLFDGTGNCLWSDSQTSPGGDTLCTGAVAKTITLTSGLFSENLGDTTVGSPTHYAPIDSSVFAAHSEVYLDVTVNGEELTPMKRITAAAYALNAHAIDGVDLIDGSGNVTVKDNQILNLGTTPGTQAQFSFDTTSIHSPSTDSNFTKLVLPSASSHNLPMVVIGTPAVSSVFSTLNTLMGPGSEIDNASQLFSDSSILLSSTTGTYNGLIQSQEPCATGPLCDNPGANGTFAFSAIEFPGGPHMDLLLSGNNVLVQGNNFNVNASGNLSAVSIAGISNGGVNPLTITSTNADSSLNWSIGADARLTIGQIDTNKNFSQTDLWPFSSTFSTGTGAVSLNGDTTVAFGKTFSTYNAIINGGTIDGTSVGSTTASSGRFTDVTATNDRLTLMTNTSGHILVGDGSHYNPVAISGSATIDNLGELTIASGAVTNAMLAGSITAANLVGTDITTVGTITTGTWSGSFGSVSGANLLNLDPTHIDSGTAGINISGTAANVTTNANLTGDVTSIGNATTIPGGTVTNAMLAGSITASNLVGTDITTVGTITTGTWSGLFGNASGGFIDGTTIGATTPSLGQFTELGTTGLISTNFTSTPTSDLWSLSNAANPVTTNGYDGLQIDYHLDTASADAVHIIPSFSSAFPSAFRNFDVIGIDAFSPTNDSGFFGTVNGFNIGDLTDPGTNIHSTAIKVGSGWDSAFDLNSGAFNIAETADPSLNLTSNVSTFNFLDAVGNSSTINIGGNATNLSNNINIATNGAGGTDHIVIGNTHSTTVSTMNGGIINFGDTATSKTINIGGNVTDGTDTINIATNNSGNADVISIGNTGTGTTTSIGGGDAWNIDTRGRLTLNQQQVGDKSITLNGFTDATSSLLSLIPKNNAGSALDITYPVLGPTGNITGIDLNLGSINGTGNSTGMRIVTPADITTNANMDITGISITGGALVTNGGTFSSWTGVHASNGNLQADNGTLIGSDFLADIYPGALVAPGDGYIYGLQVSPKDATTGNGSVVGVGIGNITDATATASTGLAIGSGWDQAINVNNGTFTVTPNGLTSIIPSSATTTPLLTLGNPGFPSNGNGGSGIQLVYSKTNGSGSAIHVTSSFSDTSGTSRTFSQLAFDGFTATNSSLTDTVNGISIGSLTEDGSITSNGLVIGSGWDKGVTIGSTTGNALDINSSTLTIDSSGNLATAGTISSTTSGSSFAPSAAPATDILSISSAAGASTTTGVDGLSVNFGSLGVSGDAIHVLPSYAGVALSASRTFSAIGIDGFGAAKSAGVADVVNGISLGNMTENPGDEARINSTGLLIGSGWDNAISVNSGTFSVASNGTISSGSGTTTIGGALTINGSSINSSTSPFDLFSSVGTLNIVNGANSSSASVSILNGVSDGGLQELDLVSGDTKTDATVNILNGDARAGGHVLTLNVASGNAGLNAEDRTVNILSGTGTVGTQTFNLGTGAHSVGINIGTGAGTDSVAIGSSHSSAALTSAHWGITAAGTETLHPDSAPTTDVLSINAAPSTTAGTYGINVASGTTGVSGGGIVVSSQFDGSGTNGLTFSAITAYMAFIANGGGGTDYVNGVYIPGISAHGSSINSTGLSIGYNWDTLINANDVFKVASSGNLTVAAGQGLDVLSSGTLNLGTATATAVTIGGTPTATIDIGKTTTAKTINIGGTGSVASADHINIGTHSATTIAIGFDQIPGTPIATSGVFDATHLYLNGNGVVNVNTEIGGNDGGSNTAIYGGGAWQVSGSGTAAFTLAVAGSHAVCIADDGGNDNGGKHSLTDCSGAPAADYAEKYPVATGATYGDIVVPGTQMVTTTDGDHISQLVKSSAPYTGPVAGIVSNNYGDFTSAGNNLNDSDNPMPVALVGRVPVNVTNENGPIAVGDYITTSSTAGYGMKATQAGRVIGMALEAFNGTSGQVMVQVNNSWYFGNLLSTDGTSTMFTDNVITAPTGTATASTPTFDSFGLELKGSTWNGSSAQTVQMALKDVVTDSNNYRLSVRNTTDSEVAYITNTGTMQVSGDVAVGGKLYPSDNGVVQKSKYIYYDGSAGPAGDYMRTNAKGWSTGSYDFAEMFPSSETLTPGEVVVFSDDKVQVRRSEKKSEKVIAGIVSTRPGFLAGDDVSDAYPIALAGRVPTNVNIEGGAIAVGDALTTSSQAGFAMKATKPGMIVGYALEPFDGSSTDQITVFVNAGYWGGQITTATPGANNSASLLGSTGNSAMTALNMSGNVNMNGNDITSIGRIAGLADAWSIEADGTIKTTALLKTVITGQNNQKVETVGVTSPEAVITLAGTAKLINGRAEIDFATVSPDFANVISQTAPIRVIATPNGPVSLYVSEKDQNHFVVQSFGSGNSDADFDWMVTAYRTGFEPVATVVSPPLQGGDQGAVTQSNAISAPLSVPSADPVVTPSTTVSDSSLIDNSLIVPSTPSLPTVQTLPTTDTLDSASSTSSSTTIVDPVATPNVGTSDANASP